LSSISKLLKDGWKEMGSRRWRKSKMGWEGKSTILGNTEVVCHSIYEIQFLETHIVLWRDFSVVAK
jgi:hypothetical protein